MENGEIHQSSKLNDIYSVINKKALLELHAFNDALNGSNFEN
jgi:hypothetical protein